MTELMAGLRGVDSATMVPLTGVEVAAEVRGAASRVRLTQRFANGSAEPIEAVYVFPLDEGAALCWLEAEVGGRRIVGQVAEREQAFEQYDDALMAGHGAFLLDQERPNILTLSVGNLPPGGEAAVTLTYVAELAREGEALRFLLPTTVAPRYVPREVDPEVGEPDAERVNPPLADDVPYRLTVRLDIDQPGGVRAVSSPTHPIRVEHDGPRAVVTFGAEEVALDRDLVLLIEPGQEALAGAVTEVGADGVVTAAVTLMPAIEVESSPAEVVFVLDCSGSMSGDSIGQARRALRLCLRQMTSDDAVNVVAFGSEFVTLFDAPRRLDLPTFEEADRWVAALDAEMGGTEILAPLQAVLSARSEAGRQRAVVLLTDGQVSNEEQVIALAAAHRATTRVFSFGIGAGASEHLVRGVARAGGGAAEFVAPGERIEPKVLRQFARLAAPRVEHLAVLPDGLSVAPRQVPAVYAGELSTVYVRGADVPPVLTLTAVGMAPQMVVLPAPRPGTLLTQLWARATIRDLEEGAVGGSAQQRRRESSRDKKVLELALAHGLLSSATSFVAVEERAPGERTTEAARLVRVPVALTHGWGGGQPLMTHLRVPMPMAPPAAGGIDAMVAEYRLCLDQDADADDDDKITSSVDFCSSMPRLDEQGRYALLMAQAPDGYFEWASVVEVVDLPEPAMAAIEGVCLDPRVKATLLAVAWLRVRWSGRQAEWRNAARKAEKWLRGVGGVRGMKIAGLPAQTWFERRVERGH